MPVRHITGDLFTAGIPVIGHGVNCQGVMGSGIAPEFKRRYPNMYQAYKNQCRAGKLTLGHMYPYPNHDGVTVLNLATQHKTGPNADLTAIHTSLTEAIRYCEQNNITEFAIPRIGAGIGGLNWADVNNAINSVGASTSVTITVVTLPQ